ncbi:hypothetical protein C8Q80DRAFT_137459 [Daedaleopsis nitida]|nr:hypothetical protein C8Q80DRAFT_137459 [Daedaleopsis nitida]
MIASGVQHRTYTFAGLSLGKRAGLLPWVLQRGCLDATLIIDAQLGAASDPAALLTGCRRHELSLGCQASKRSDARAAPDCCGIPIRHRAGGSKEVTVGVTAAIGGRENTAGGKIAPKMSGYYSIRTLGGLAGCKYCWPLCSRRWWLARDRVTVLLLVLARRDCRACHAKGPRQKRSKKDKAHRLGWGPSSRSENVFWLPHLRPTGQLRWGVARGMRNVAPARGGVLTVADRAQWTVGALSVPELKAETMSQGKRLEIGTSRMIGPLERSSGRRRGYAHCTVDDCNRD